MRALALVAVVLALHSNPGVATAQVQWFQSAGADPNGDLEFQASLTAPMSEFALDDLGCEVLVDILESGIDANLLNDDGSVHAGAMRTFCSSLYFVYPGVCSGTTLLNAVEQDSTRTIEFAFDEPREGFGTWIFDDDDDSAFRLTVVTAAGDQFASEWFNGTQGSLLVDGFLGASYAGGISRVLVEESNKDYFELDHIQVGGPSSDCYPDFDGDGQLSLFDFLGYVNAFNAEDPSADCDGDGDLTLFDFLCFVNAFNEGC